MIEGGPGWILQSDRSKVRQQIGRKINFYFYYYDAPHGKKAEFGREVRTINFFHFWVTT